MMTNSQIADLTKLFRIDRFTIFREYLQLIFLNHLYVQPQASKVYFKGGTAIHLLFNSPRFSEDLDFSTILSLADVGRLIKKTEADMRREILGIKILLWHRGKQGTRFKLIYKSADFKYPMVIRIDISFGKPLRPASSPLLTKFPIAIFPIISHLQTEEIFAEKIRAIMHRQKGRDVYDLWYLLAQGAKLDLNLIAEKFKYYDEKFVIKELIERVAGFAKADFINDLKPFVQIQERDKLGELFVYIVGFIKHISLKN